MEKNMFDNTLILETICLYSAPVQLFLLHRTSSCFYRIISSQVFWRRKFARDGLLQIPFTKKDYVWAWLAEYNRRREAKVAVHAFKTGSGKQVSKGPLTLEEVNSLGIKDITPCYNNYYCELNFCRRKGVYFYVLHVVRKVVRQPGRFYHDVKQYQSFRKEMSREAFYRLLFLYYYKLG
nr:hypothetical protein Cbor_390 [Cedratvirus borely]